MDHAPSRVDIAAHLAARDRAPRINITIDAATGHGTASLDRSDVAVDRHRARCLKAFETSDDFKLNCTSQVLPLNHAIDHNLVIRY